MTKMEELKKRVDLNTKECTKCTKNSTAYKKPHHPTCLYAKAWTPARKVVLDALTDWEKQSLNLPTKKKYVELGLLPRSIFKSRPPPRSTVARVETNVQLGLLPSSIFESRPPPQNTVTRVETNAVVGPVTNKLMATVTNDTRTAENNDLPLLEVLLPPKLPPKNLPLSFIVDDDLTTSVGPPLSLKNFRIHQQLNHVAPMPPAAVPVPVPVFSMGQSTFPFPFCLQPCFTSTVQKPATVQTRKRGREREFLCFCEKERYEQLGRKKPGPTMHTNACKLNKMFHG